MVRVMEVMVTSFKRTYASMLQLPELFVVSVPGPAAGHCRPMPLPAAPGLSQASLGQSLVWSLLLSLGS